MSAPPEPGERRDLPEPRPNRADRTLPGDTTVPTWVMASIVLGLVALTGSIAAISLVALGAVLVWLAKTPPVDTTGHPSRWHFRDGGPWG
jgi:hypothetical protein